MARMIPATISLDTQSNAEIRLFPLLKKSLDDSFTVFHSFDLLTKNLQQKFIEGEIDFLIFSPQYGLLVLEVKGGGIVYDGSTGVWYQNNHELKMSPSEQAKNSKYKLLDFLEDQLKHKPRVCLGHAVCFPDVFTDIKTSPSGMTTDICITGNQLSDLKKHIISIMGKFNRDFPITSANPETENIVLVLMPYCEYGTSLADLTKQADRKIFSLTEQQCEVLNIFSEYKRVLIKGCAGSGKTIMAVKKAKELAAEGQNVLLLTYNILIGNKLAKEVQDYPEITACHYHQFCETVVQETEVPFPNRKDPQYWTTLLPLALLEALNQQPRKYDAVIVDEAQDFKTDWWETINELVKDDGYYYIFYDPEQNIWDNPLDFPTTEVRGVLDQNCRNTRTIFEKLLPYTETAMKLAKNAPDGEQVIEYICSSQHDTRKQLGSILHDLVNNNGIKPEEIIILGARNLKNTCLDNNNTIGNFQITESDEMKPNSISYHTYMKFKGCEACAVILLEVEEEGKWAGTIPHYTAISRAQHLLYILRKGY
jgi:thymidine kinase